MAPGQILFHGTSTAGSGTFTINGTESFFGLLVFYDTATAGNGTFTLNGNGNGAICQFNGGSADASTWTINGADDINHGAGNVDFFAGDAGSAIFVANAGLNGGSGGEIFFLNDSTGGTSRIEVFGSGTDDPTSGVLDISQHVAPGVTIGLLEGSGLVQLGSNKLTVGGNNLTTVFSGIIKEGSLGSLAKTGKGKFTLSNANTYTGGTTVSKGTLLVTNRVGSATGTGTVSVTAGTFGGTGKISGPVTIGTATATGTLAPGSGTKPGTLTLSSTLTFNAHGNYKVDLNSTRATFDKVVAKGVTITSGATVAIADLGPGTLTSGTVFTIISNTANTAISGTFSNLADGTTLVLGNNTYLVSYSGGTGNDLTLTVQ